MKNSSKKQMSDTLLIGILLAGSGGFLDAYTYLLRGKVFANAQTGNMVLFGISLVNHNIKGMFCYLLPIFFFFLGVLIAEIVKDCFKEKENIHWRQIILMIECLMLALTSLFPSSLNLIANSIISFVCSLQVEAFRKLQGNPYATTMCTGNLRSAAWHFYNYLKNKEQASLTTSLRYFIIIGFFILGAVAGAFLCEAFSLYAIFFAVLLLFTAIILMW